MNFILRESDGESRRLLGRTEVWFYSLLIGIGFDGAQLAPPVGHQEILTERSAGETSISTAFYDANRTDFRIPHSLMTGICVIGICVTGIGMCVCADSEFRLGPSLRIQKFGLN